MVVNGDCSFLKNGEERNWFFQGEEAWDFPLREGAVSNAGTGGGGGGNIIPATELGGPGTLPDEAVATEAMVAKDSAKI
jgi:transcription factor C subunit 7